METMTAWEALKAHLQQPEYWHVLINPLPVYGVAMGWLAMGLAFLLKEQRARWLALALVALSALSIWPVMELGEAGYDRMVSVMDANGALWLDEHWDRAEQVAWIFYLTAGLAVAAAVVPLRWPRTMMPLFVAAWMATTATLAAGGWVAFAGGQVRHTEFRYGPPPKPAEHPSREHD